MQKPFGSCVIRPGNNRLDTLVNILANPTVGLLFIIPGFDDTLRVNGRATLMNDPELLKSMIANDRAPKLAIVAEVREVFMDCAKAFRRSRLWSPDRFHDRTDMPYEDHFGRNNRRAQRRE
jgi:predicted pyridoxine 5'-phosphate oxidase superfamily flavin-nucleotide-binding protein